MSPSPRASSSTSESVLSLEENGSESDSSDSEGRASQQHGEDGGSDLRSDESDAESKANDSGESEDDDEPVKTASKVNKGKRKHDEVEDKPTAEGGATATGADVQVLSRAEKRRQKRKEQKELNAQPETSISEKRNKSQKVVDVPPANSAKRQNSVWVGNLSYKTTVNDLRTYFVGIGEITRINMPTKSTSGRGRMTENQGFAYVDFATPEAKLAAIAMSEQPLIGRKLLIKDGDDFSGRPQGAGDASLAPEQGEGNSNPKTHSKTAQKILRAQKQPPGPTLFLGNLGFETTEADILEMLAAHRSTPAVGGGGGAVAGKHSASRGSSDGNFKNGGGGKSSDDGAETGGRAKAKSETKEASTSSTRSWIRKVRMGTFEDSGLCKGFAFVDFVSTEEATSTLINPKNYFLNGRKLVVEYASPEAVRRGAPKGPGKLAGMERELGKRPKPSLVARAEANEGNEGDTVMDDKNPEQPPSKRQRMEKLDNKWTPKPDQRRGPRSRAKPGAALASAQRASFAIMPSQGKKIKFN
ncbi:hypothetical protein AX15_005293 [Amanita polypyramis BW_CC]|nr:hypothetical protein AX15_005293 [Amanita polypyramis BW_CC]